MKMKKKVMPKKK